MDITTFMIAVYCLIDDNFVGQRLRRRGPQPTLRDSEVLTIEVVGEFLGLDTESSIFTHFCRYYSDHVHPPGCQPMEGETRPVAEIGSLDTAGSLHLDCG
jgi:hypothetical protein